jgi:ubiquinone/menaquinone biosynthesis C-methylase UbiE
MQVLVIGPHRPDDVINAAKRTQPQGRVTVISGDQQTFRKLQERLDAEGLDNVILGISSPEGLPLADSSIDRAFLVLPRRMSTDVRTCLEEAHRVLVVEGWLVIYLRSLSARFLRRESLMGRCSVTGFDAATSHETLLDSVFTFEKHQV